MKVSVKNIGDFKVNDLSYRQARDLRRFNSRIWWKKDSNELSADEYFDLLDEVEQLSGLDEKVLGKYKGAEVDQILQAILMEYIGESDDSKKD